MASKKQSIESRAGEKLRALREMKNGKKKRMTLPEAAKGSGVGARCLSDYEKGVRLPGTENLIKLAEFYGISPSSILKG